MTGREWRCLMLTLISTLCLGSKNGSLVQGEVLQDAAGQCHIVIHGQDISNINSSHCINVVVVGSVTIDCDQIRDEQLATFQLVTEITGFLSIINCNRSIPLHNLTVLHGHTQTSLSPLQQSFLTSVGNYSSAEMWSLLVFNSSLDQLQLYGLREVVRGSIFIHDTGRLCVHQSVRWSDIISSRSQMAHSVLLSDCVIAVECHTTCHRACWGPDLNHCQAALSWDDCETACYHRCHTGGCCHSECVGGCSGPDIEHCIACRHFRNNGSCVANCAPLSVYDPLTHQLTILPDGEYLLHYDCVKECPELYKTYEECCVLECPSGTTENNGVCEICNGVCPKVCLGSGQLPGESPHITSLYIDRFINCTHINGSIILNKSSLEGNVTMGVPPMTQGSLWALSNLEEVTGYVVIEGLNVTSLRFLHNLCTVGGKEQFMAAFSSFSIVIKDNPLLATLSLVSLRLVERGDIQITNCPQLCLADTLLPENIFKDNSQQCLELTSLNLNCMGVNCHRECDSMAGCWGTGADECVHCRNYNYSNSCVPSCDQSHSYEEHSTCLPCHDQCNLGGCYGPAANQCIMGCRCYTDGPYCVAECPPLVTYLSGNNSCQPCDPLCYGSGCSGNGSHLGPGGCNECYIILNINGTDYCVESCPLGYQLVQYPLRANSTYAGFLVCIKEQPMVVADNTQITTRSLITSSSSVSAFFSEGITSSSAQLSLSPSITTTPFTGSSSGNTNFYRITLIMTIVLIGVVIIAILLALVVYRAYTNKSTVKVAVMKTNVDLKEATHKRTTSGDSQTLLDYTTSKQGLLRRTSIATLANGAKSEHNSLAVATSSPAPSGCFSQPQSRLGDGLSLYTVSPNMVITEREKKPSASLKSSSLSHNHSQLSVGTMPGEQWSPHHDGMVSRHSTGDNFFATGGSPHPRASSCYSPSIQLPGSVLEEPLTHQ